MFPDLLHDDVFRLETRRLWLRWPRAADAAEIARLAGDAEVAVATARIPHPYPAEAATAFVLQTRRGNSRANRQPSCSLPKNRPWVPLGAIALGKAGEDRLKLGYWLGRPHWRQGLMTEAVRAMAGLAFTWTPAREIVAVAQAENAASQRLLENCGFRLVGGALEAAPARTEPRLACRFSLGREEWTESVDTPRQSSGENIN